MKAVTEIRCSKLSRPMSCAGYLRFTDLHEEETSEAAKEGTAFGEYVERILTKQEITTHAKNGFPFDDDMKFFSEAIVNDIIDRAGRDQQIFCEQRIDWQTRSGIWVRGSYDISYETDGGSTLCVDDNKYGWGLVEVKDNWQLLGYAIGEVIRRQKNYNRIVLRIYQPRPHHEDGILREHVLTYAQLCEYKEQIEARFDKIASGFSELATGKQCKYCPAAASACTAYNRAVYHSVDYVLSDFKQDNITEKEIATQLDMLGRISEVLKIKKDSIEQLAISRIKNGAIIPDYMTEQRFGDRKWKPIVSPLVIETLTGKKIVKEEMLSPAQAEKVGVPKDLVAKYVDRHFLGMKLVRKDASALGNKIFGNKGV